MTTNRIRAEIAQLKASEAEFTAMLVGLNAEILEIPDWAHGRYEKLTGRALGLEAQALRLAARRQALEAQLAPVGVQ